MFWKNHWYFYYTICIEIEIVMKVIIEIQTIYHVLIIISDVKSINNWFERANCKLTNIKHIHFECYRTFTSIVRQLMVQKGTILRSISLLQFNYFDDYFEHGTVQPDLPSTQIHEVLKRTFSKTIWQVIDDQCCFYTYRYSDIIRFTSSS